MAHHRPPPGGAGHLQGGGRFRQRANLVGLKQNGVARPFRYAPLQPPDVGHQQVVAHQLRPVAQPPRQPCPPVPVILIQPVLNADDGVLRPPARVQIHQLGGGERYPLPFQVVPPRIAVPQLRRRHIQGNVHLLAGAVARRFNRPQHYLNGVPVGSQRRRKTALVPHIEIVPAGPQDALQRLVNFHARPQRRAEALKPGGNHHKLLHIGGIGSVPPAVQNVQHRRRQRYRPLARQMPPEGTARPGRGRRPRHRH